MNLDTVHVVQRFHHAFVMKITEGSAWMNRHLDDEFSVA